MKKEAEKKEIKAPEGIEIELNQKENELSVKGEKGELKKRFDSNIKISQENKTVILTPTSHRRKVKALLGTSAAEIKNMFHGLRDGIIYKLKVVYSHFPVNLKVKEKSLWIENFLGEKYPRKARILEGVEVEIKGQEIEVKGIDKERVGQTAANIEQATKIKKKDKRVFQDGCYIYEKDGRLLK